MKLNEYSVTDGEDFIVPNEVCSMGSLHVWGEDEPAKNNIWVKVTYNLKQ